MDWKQELEELHQWCVSTRKEKEFWEEKEEEKFKTECIRFSKVIKRYVQKFEELHSSVFSKIVRKEYSKGGEILTRGYYCPSPILDIVTGNCKRGKLLKRIACITNPDYEYCFDENNKLILVNYLYSNQVEILEYIDDVVIGITFARDEDNEIIALTECKYDSKGQISSFIVARRNFTDGNIDEIHRETYFYNQQGLYRADIYDFLDDKEYPHLNYERYKFVHDNQGYLKEYRCETSIIENNLYKVGVKRRV